jgi:hypothetical protein
MRLLKKQLVQGRQVIFLYTCCWRYLLSEITHQFSIPPNFFGGRFSYLAQQHYYLGCVAIAYRPLALLKDKTGRHPSLGRAGAAAVSGAQQPHFTPLCTYLSGQWMGEEAGGEKEKEREDKCYY